MPAGSEVQADVLTVDVLLECLDGREMAAGELGDRDRLACQIAGHRDARIGPRIDAQMGFSVEVGDEPAGARAGTHQYAPAAIAEAGRLRRHHRLVRLAHEATGTQLIPFRRRGAEAVIEAHLVEIAPFDGDPLVQSLGQSWGMISIVAIVVLLRVADATRRGVLPPARPTDSQLTRPGGSGYRSREGARGAREGTEVPSSVKPLVSWERV